MQPVVLVVDDERQMVSIVTFALETQGFQCLTARDVPEALRLLRQQHVDLAVLDVMLPMGSGVDLTRRIRATGSDMPIILLSALGAEKDRIAGLEAGADDYMTKPFSPRELALRAQAMLRRSLPAKALQRLEAGPLVVDRAAEEAWWDGVLLPLNAVDLRLLAVLAARPDEVVTQRTILNEAWGTDELGGSRDLIKTSVYRLRKALGAAGVDPAVIEARRGQGYVLRIR